MGALTSRQNARVEEVDLGANDAYRYPPKSGNYFASHFIMGGERFETTQPEAYLFGENMDLNFLGGKPTPFPYPAPQPNEPTRPLKSHINIRKESLRFVRVPEDPEPDPTAGSKSNTLYNIEFTFDSDVKCAITIYYFCSEEIMASGVVYTPRDPAMNSETYHYKRGVNQQFVQVSHTFDPSSYLEEELTFKFEDEIMPVVIQCVAEEGEEPRQSHMLIAVVEKNSDATYTLKPLKQKLFVDGLCYLLQEIYGIENKNINHTKDLGDDEVEDSGSECVICMSDSRDTLILPCRHLCLCNSCADSLRYQANNCPICRAPFRALLQIRAVQKSVTSISHIGSIGGIGGGGGDNQASQDIPPGYEPVSLIEALNGPMQTSSLSVPPAPLNTVSPGTPKKRNLDRNKAESASSLRAPEGSSSSDKEDSGSDRPQDTPPTPDLVISAIVSPHKSQQKPQTMSLSRNDVRRHKKGCRTSSAPEKVRLLDTVQVINETGGIRRKVDRDLEAAETRSLLETSILADGGITVAVSMAKGTWPVCRSSPISMSTPHSLHLCDKNTLGPDTSPGGDDSDYYTPEDPATTILVDQGTDTSLDSPQAEERPRSPEISLNRTKFSLGRTDPELSVGFRRRSSTRREERGGMIEMETIVQEHMEDKDSESRRGKNASSGCELEDRGIRRRGSHTPLTSPNRRPVVSQMDGSVSLPGTPASNASHRSSGDSFSSTSSTRLLLPQQSHEVLPE